jgi:hypothetical protein
MSSNKETPRIPLPRGESSAFGRPYCLSSWGGLLACRSYTGELVSQEGHTAGDLSLRQPVQQQRPLESVGIQ